MVFQAFRIKIAHRSEKKEEEEKEKKENIWESFGLQKTSL